MTNREQPDPGDGWRPASGDDYKDVRCEIWLGMSGKWYPRINMYSDRPFDISQHYRIPIDAPQPATHHGGDHYQSLAIQPWDYSTANRLEYNEGVVVAYVTRWRSKGGVEDLQKAIDHINKLIEFETKEATK